MPIKTKENRMGQDIEEIIEETKICPKCYWVTTVSECLNCGKAGVFPKTVNFYWWIAKKIKEIEGEINV